MQFSGSKLLIKDAPTSEVEFAKLIPIQQINQIQNTQKIEQHELRTPLISVLFGYKGGAQFEGFQLQLELQFIIKGEKMNHKQVACKRTSNYLYKVVEIDSCLCYQKQITLSITIKYAQNQQCQEIKSVQELSHQLSQRAFVIYSEKTLSAYKRDIIIKQPVNTLYRYSPSGYIWMKCSNLSIDSLTIKNIQLMNWLVNSNEQLKLFQSKSSLQNQMALKKQESIGVLLSLPKYLSKQEIPYAVQFSLTQYPQFTFKMMKYLYLS